MGTISALKKSSPGGGIWAGGGGTCGVPSDRVFAYVTLEMAKQIATVGSIREGVVSSDRGLYHVTYGTVLDSHESEAKSR